MKDFSVVLAKYGEPRKVLSYGTAGFRDNFDLPLDYVFVRMGILAVLRKASLNGQCVGAVITASHNPECDNGIKLVDCDGGMLSRNWEPLAVELASSTVADFEDTVAKLVEKYYLDETFYDMGVVLIGRDTRPHSNKFHKCMEEGVQLMGGRCADLGEVTTPMLHYAVRDMNQSLKANTEDKPFDATYWTDRYFHTVSTGYQALVQTSAVPVDTHVVVDSAFGVGSIALSNFITYYNRLCVSGTHGALPKLTIDIRNPARTGTVNDNCGAEHAQKLQLPPIGVDAEGDVGKLLCSFDGDGDRIVFHAFLPTAAGAPQWILLDGDKIAALIAMLLQQELAASGLSESFNSAVIQTAYANGASTAFIHSLGMPIYMAKTGVKYLHHKAKEFDVGVYFEANGHGTVVFSERFVQAVEEYVPTSADGKNRKDIAYERLKASIKLINPAVGDALSDMLYCLAALQVLDMDLVRWHDLYTDLPSKQQKVGVPDKSMVACSEDETAVVRPQALQDDLVAAMQTVRHGRCFVRPSGTEDVVRIYAEAATQEEANKLTDLTFAAIRKHLG